MILKKITDSDESILSRYMDFNKLSFLLEKGLYFPNLKKFDDPMDGTTSLQKFSTRILHIQESEQIDQDIDLSKLADKNTVKSQIDSYQKNAFASCWFKSKNELDESLAMWELYTMKEDGFLLQLNKNSLLDVLSSVNKIKDCHNEIHFGSVSYFSFPEEIINPNPEKILYPAFVKNISFEHEKEFRIVIYRNRSLKEIECLVINIDLINAFKDITLIAHPKMEKEIFDKFKDYFRNLNIDLKRSSLMTREKVRNIFN